MVLRREGLSEVLSKTKGPLVTGWPSGYTEAEMDDLLGSCDPRTMGCSLANRDVRMRSPWEMGGEGSKGLTFTSHHHIQVLSRHRLLKAPTR